MKQINIYGSMITILALGFVVYANYASGNMHKKKVEDKIEPISQPVDTIRIESDHMIYSNKSLLLYKNVMNSRDLIAALIIILFLFGNWLWGLVGFLLNIIIFYYCLGPDNAFYPPAAELLKRGENPAQPYFERVNSQLFTPVFWYLLLGPVTLFFYRINFWGSIYFCLQKESQSNSVKL